MSSQAAVLLIAQKKIMNFEIKCVLLSHSRADTTAVKTLIISTILKSQILLISYSVSSMSWTHNKVSEHQIAVPSFLTDQQLQTRSLGALLLLFHWAERSLKRSISWCFTRGAGNSDLTPRRELSAVVVKGNEDEHSCGIKFLELLVQNAPVTEKC